MPKDARSPSATIERLPTWRLCSRLPKACCRARLQRRRRIRSQGPCPSSQVGRIGEEWSAGARVRICARVLFCCSPDALLTKSATSGHFYLNSVTKYLTELITDPTIGLLCLD